MTRTILLDAAGTLIEPAEPVATVYARHFALAGWEVREEPIKKAFRVTFEALGSPDYESYSDGDLAERAWWRRVVFEAARHCGVDPGGPAFETCFQALFAHYERGEAWRVFPEVPEFFAKVREMGCRLAIVSNFDRRLHRIFEGLGLTSAFEFIITSADARCRKPGSGIFLAALERLSASASEAVHIGDSEVADGAGAAQAGLDFFILHRPETSLLDALAWIKLKK